MCWHVATWIFYNDDVLKKIKTISIIYLIFVLNLKMKLVRYIDHLEISRHGEQHLEDPCQSMGSSKILRDKMTFEIGIC